MHTFSINGKLQGYKVKFKETKSLGDNWKAIVIKVNETQQPRRKRSLTGGVVSFNLKGLKPYTFYTVIVLAFTIKDGVPTLGTNFTTAQDGMSYELQY